VAEQCDARREEHAADILVDYMLKAESARARFGQFDRASVPLQRAEDRRRRRLHEFTFRIERIKSGLRDTCQYPNELLAEGRGVRGPN